MTKAKPRLEPREPPDRAAVDAFIRGGPAPAPPAPKVPTRGTGRKVSVRKDGREIVKSTLYLPTELARRLAVRAAELGQDQTQVLERALMDLFAPGEAIERAIQEASRPELEAYAALIARQLATKPLRKPT